MINSKYLVNVRYSKLPNAIINKIDHDLRKCGSTYLFVLNNQYHVKPLITATDVLEPSFKMIEMITPEDFYEKEIKIL